MLQLAILPARGGPITRTDYLEHSVAARAVLDRWPAMYSPTHEIFVERTTGREDGFPPPPFVHRTQGRWRKALLRIRFAEALEAECGPIPPRQRGRFFPRPEDAEARNAWAYVSWYASAEHVVVSVTVPVRSDSSYGFEPAAGPAAFFPRTHSSNQARLRFIASSISFGSWIPCGVRGYVTIFTGTLRRLSAP